MWHHTRLAAHVELPSPAFCCSLLCVPTSPQVKPHVDHTWVRLGSGGEAEVEEALLAAVQADPDYQAGCARVLVFTKNTANADRVRHTGLSGVEDLPSSKVQTPSEAQRVW